MTSLKQSLDSLFANRVTSVFGRRNEVEAQPLDYSSDLITNDSTVAGGTLSAALDTLQAAGDFPIASVFGRVGAVGSVLGDYLATLVTNDSGVSGSSVAAALDVLANRIVNLATSQVANESALTGATVSDALDTLTKRTFHWAQLQFDTTFVGNTTHPNTFPYSSIIDQSGGFALQDSNRLFTVPEDGIYLVSVSLLAQNTSHTADPSGRLIRLRSSSEIKFRAGGTRYSADTSNFITWQGCQAVELLASETHYFECTTGGNIIDISSSANYSRVTLARVV